MRFTIIMIAVLTLSSCAAVDAAFKTTQKAVDVVSDAKYNAKLDAIKAADTELKRLAQKRCRVIDLDVFPAAAKMMGPTWTAKVLEDCDAFGNWVKATVIQLGINSNIIRLQQK